MINKTELDDFLKIVEDISFTNEEKNKLKSIWKDEFLLKIFIKIKNNVTNKMLTDNLSADFVKWAIYTISYLRWLMR